MATPRPNPTDDREDAEPAPYRPGPHRVALAAAAFTWPLIFVGGLVTTYRVGMAVPDWPTTFGINMFLFDMRNAAWGVFVEHGHRLYGAGVGLATVVLTAWFFAAGARRELKVLALVALLGVIGQGVLGGYRVRLNSTTLAAVHGVTAQAFFGLMVVLCVLTDKGWSAPPSVIPDPAHLRRRAATTLTLLYAQVIAGAWLRHAPSSNGLNLHTCLAALAFGVGLATARDVIKRRAELAELVPAAWALASLLLAQVALGIAAWLLLRPFDGVPRFVTNAQALVRTGHQANGALLVGAAVVLALRAFRGLAPTPSAFSASPSPVPLEREALA